MAKREANKLAYPHGAMLCYPHSDGSAVQLTFVGKFGRRKLRNMLRAQTPLKKKEEIEWAIDNLVTQLVPQTGFKEQVRALYEEGRYA